MTTVQERIQAANLSNVCKADLLDGTAQIELQSSALPKRAVTVQDDNLPPVVFAGTVSQKRRADTLQASRTETVERFQAAKATQRDATQSALGWTTDSKSGSSYSKSYKATYHSAPTRKDPFRDSRSRGNLSGKDECFVHQYAEALTKTSIPREPKADAASVAAAQAYEEAFRRYTGRAPNGKEMEEVDRLNFGFDEHGRVGVIQSSHTCFPHTHVTSAASSRPAQCPNQIYHSEVPPIRGARERFPGPIPVWSSTKNLSAMVSADSYQAGHQQTSSAMRDAVDTVVGSR